MTLHGVVMNENERGMPTVDPPTAVNRFQDFLIPLAILVVWFVLQKWVLPRFGVST